MIGADDFEDPACQQLKAINRLSYVEFTIHCSAHSTQFAVS